MTELVRDLEDKIMDSKNNRSKAVQVFRNAQCLRGDFRIYAIFTEALNYLTSSFKRQEGILRFANTNMHLGNIVNRHLNLTIYADTKMHLGACITSTLIKHKYAILRREEFFTIEEIKIDKKLTSIRLQPYQLEIGEKLFNIKYLSKERLGISTTKFPIWEKQQRVVDGVKEGLIKGKVQLIGNKQPFLKAVNNLEQVKWEINPTFTHLFDRLAHCGPKSFRPQSHSFLECFFSDDARLSKCKHAHWTCSICSRHRLPALCAYSVCFPPTEPTDTCHPPCQNQHQAPDKVCRIIFTSHPPVVW